MGIKKELKGMSIKEIGQKLFFRHKNEIVQLCNDYGYKEFIHKVLAADAFGIMYNVEIRSTEVEILNLCEVYCFLESDNISLQSSNSKSKLPLTEIAKNEVLSSLYSRIFYKMDKLDEIKPITLLIKKEYDVTDINVSNIFHYLKEKKIPNTKVQVNELVIIKEIYLLLLDCGLLRKGVLNQKNTNSLTNHECAFLFDLKDIVTIGKVNDYKTIKEKSDFMRYALKNRMDFPKISI